MLVPFDIVDVALLPVWITSCCVALIARSVAVSALPVKFPADNVPLTVTLLNVEVPVDTSMSVSYTHLTLPTNLCV